MEELITIVIYLVNSQGSYQRNVAKNSLRQAVAKHVIRLIRESREKQGLSMNSVAQRSGLSQGMVSLVEHGLRNPSLDTLLRLAEALDVDLGDLIKKAKKAALTGQ